MSVNSLTYTFTPSKGKDIVVKDGSKAKLWQRFDDGNGEAFRVVVRGKEYIKRRSPDNKKVTVTIHDVSGRSLDGYKVKAKTGALSRVGFSDPDGGGSFSYRAEDPHWWYFLAGKSMKGKEGEFCINDDFTSKFRTEMKDRKWSLDTTYRQERQVLRDRISQIDAQLAPAFRRLTHFRDTCRRAGYKGDTSLGDDLIPDPRGVTVAERDEALELRYVELRNQYLLAVQDYIKFLADNEFQLATQLDDDIPPNIHDDEEELVDLVRDPNARLEAEDDPNFARDKWAALIYGDKVPPHVAGGDIYNRV